jgi:hypothetical protein
MKLSLMFQRNRPKRLGKRRGGISYAAERVRCFFCPLQRKYGIGKKASRGKTKELTFI